MGFIPEHLPPSQAGDSLETGEVGYRPNVGGSSVTRIEDTEDGPVYGPEIRVELGFWAREIPVGTVAPGWSHRWYRLECRRDPEQHSDRPLTMDALQRASQALAAARQRTVRGRPSIPLCEALLRIGNIRQALGQLDEALSTYLEAREATEAASTAADEAIRRSGPAAGAVAASKHARVLLARSHVGLGETLLALAMTEDERQQDGGIEGVSAPSSRLAEAMSSLLLARDLLGPVVENMSRAHDAELLRCIEALAKAYEATGHDQAAAQLHAEMVGRGSVAPGDTLIVAETPIAGRRRVDRAVFRRGLNRKKPHFGKALAQEIERRAAQEFAATGVADLARLALAALEDPSIVRNDPFTTNKKVLIAGVSLPTPPFWEPEHDYTPSWSDDDDARTGWLLGVCANPERVHARVLEVLDAVVEQAQVGKLWLYSPRNTPAAAVRPSGDIIGEPARKLAPHAAWLAMAGAKEPVQQGQKVASVALRVLNDLLYNYERRVTGRGRARVGPPEKRSGELESYVAPAPLVEQHRRIMVKLQAAKHDDWAITGKRLLDMCKVRSGPHHDWIFDLKVERKAYLRRYRGTGIGADEVIDYVEDWIDEVEDQILAKVSTR